MLALALTLLAVPAVNTWTVDDDGPADFAQISDAVAQVAAGDELLVEPGDYLSFDLDKRLSILGRPGEPRPHVSGLTRVNAASFTLAGLDLDALRVFGVGGRARVDDCRIGDLGDAGQEYALVLDACAQAVISRSSAQGSDAYSAAFKNIGGGAMQIRTSNVTLVRCSLQGAQGADGHVSSEFGGHGGAGLDVRDGSRVLSAASAIVGGPEGFGCCMLSCHDGPSGAGLKLFSSSAVLRGAPGVGGSLSAGWIDFTCFSTMGADIEAAMSSVVISGVSFDPDNVVLSPGSTLIQPVVPEPLIVIDGPDGAGVHKTIRIYGPAGAPCLLAASFEPNYAPLGQFDDNLWVGLSGFFVLVPLTMMGQGQPVTLAFHVPASLAGLEGLSIEMQPFFPGLASAYAPGKSLAGNVAEIILRF